MRRAFATCLLVFLTLLPSTWCRITRGSIKLGGGQADYALFHYVDKFSFGIGQGKYRVRARLKSGNEQIGVKFQLWLDEHWRGFEGLHTCEPDAITRAKKQLEWHITAEKWSKWQHGKLTQNIRPHIWYFALTGCETLDEAQKQRQYEVEYEVECTQTDGSHLSSELLYMPASLWIAVFTLAAFLMHFFIRSGSVRKSSGDGYTIILLLGLSLFVQLCAQILHLLHLYMYEKQGFSESFLETFAEMSFMCSQVLVSSLLLGIAQGYTLSRDRQIESMMPTVSGLVVVHVILVVIGRLQGDHADKHHENEGAVGLVLVLVRVALYVWFLRSCQSLQGGSTSMKLQGFLQGFKIAGSLYFLSYPVIFVIVQIFAPYLRYPVNHIGLLLMQIASTFWLSDLFMSKGAYFEVSTLSASMLPGAGKSD